MEDNIYHNNKEYRSHHYDQYNYREEKEGWRANKWDKEEQMAPVTPRYNLLPPYQGNRYHNNMDVNNHRWTMDDRHKEEGYRPPKNYHNSSSLSHHNQSRGRRNSKSSGSSSSSDSSISGRTGLSDEELKEYVKFIKDLWSRDSFVQDFKNYSIVDHKRVRQLLDEIESRERLH